MTDLVDQMFPPIHRQFTPEFTDFNYWRTPVQEFELPVLSPPSPTLSARSDTSTQTTFSRIRNFSLGRRSGKQYALPAATTARNGQENRESGRRTPLRDVRSFEELRSGLAGVIGGAEDMSEESGSSTLADSEDERRGRKRLSMDSMPGSLPGSVGSHFSGKFGDEDEDEDDEGDGDDEEDAEEDDYDGGMEDPEEAVEEGFDEDFRAMGEMENVPF